MTLLSISTVFFTCSVCCLCDVHNAMSVSVQMFLNMEEGETCNRSKDFLHEPKQHMSLKMLEIMHTDHLEDYGLEFRRLSKYLF